MIIEIITHPKILEQYPDFKDAPTVDPHLFIACEQSTRNCRILVESVKTTSM